MYLVELHVIHSMNKYSMRDSLEPAVRLMRRMLPKNRWGDYMSSLIAFVHCHGRIPKRIGGDINDALFSLKNASIRGLMTYW